MSPAARVGLISDTHGHLDPRVHDVFADVDAIVHAGDICSDAILHELETIAPVTAALGNCDEGGLVWFDVPFIGRTTVAGARIVAIHDIGDLGETPRDIEVVVCGHTHLPGVQYHGRVLVVNPGSASRPRLGFGPSVALLEIGSNESIEAHIVMLDDAGA